MSLLDSIRDYWEKLSDRERKMRDEILRRCDGTSTLGDLIANLESTFEQRNLTKDVNDFVTMAIANGWLRTKP